jgi:hypothetical protein
MENTDLFEHPDLLPPDVQQLIEHWEEKCINGISYEQCAEMQRQFNTMGYTFDYYLDAQPHSLRKL